MSFLRKKSERTSSVKEVALHVVVFEVAFFSFVFLAVGYSLQPGDPLLLFQPPFPPVLLLLVVMALFRGITAGLLTLSLVTVLSQILYQKLLIAHLLWLLVITLVLGEFRHFWRRRIKNAEAEALYYRERLESIQKHFAFLKISHDQLENNYIVRPYSLRRALEELKQKLTAEYSDERVAHFLLLLLAREFTVYRAALYRGNITRGFTLLACTAHEDAEELDLTEPMIREALHRQGVHYVSWNAVEKAPTPPRYLAVIPWKFQDAQYLLVIHDMAFTNLNDEVMHYLYLLVSFVFEEVHIKKEIISLSEVEQGKVSFLRELQRVFRFYEEFSVDSTLVLFDAIKEGSHEELKIRRKLRLLDVLYRSPNGKMIVLLPFTNPAGAQGFLERVREEMPTIEVKSMIPVRKEPTVLLHELDLGS